MKRIIALFLTVIAVFALTVNCFAAETAKESKTTVTETKAPETKAKPQTKTVPETKTPDNSGRLSPDGNMTLNDDVKQSETVGDEAPNKQFITVQSKNGNTFYLIIDRNGEEENVYFLNAVDEADLFALMEDENGDAPECICKDFCTEDKVNESCPVCSVSKDNCKGKEAKETTKASESKKTGSKSNTNLILIIVLVAVGGGIAFWFFKKRGKKSGKRVDSFDDDYDFDDEEADEETDISDAEKRDREVEEALDIITEKEND